MRLPEVAGRNYMRAEVTWIKHVSCGNSTRFYRARSNSKKNPRVSRFSNPAKIIPIIHVCFPAGCRPQKYSHTIKTKAICQNVNLMTARRAFPTDSHDTRVTSAPGTWRVLGFWEKGG